MGRILTFPAGLKGATKDALTCTERASIISKCVVRLDGMGDARLLRHSERIQLTDQEEEELSAAFAAFDAALRSRSR